MEQQITKYKKIYKIFLALMLIAFIDSIILPILFSSMGKDLGEIGFIPRLFALIAGSVGAMIGMLFDTLWFVWGLVAVIANRLANRLEKKLANPK